MSSLQYLKVVICFLILTELMRFSVEFCVVKFSSFWVKDLMDFGKRSGKSLSLGCPRHPKVKFKDNQNPKLGDAPEGIPSFVFVHR